VSGPGSAAADDTARAIAARLMQPPAGLFTQLIQFGRRADVSTAHILLQIPGLKAAEWIDHLAPEAWQSAAQHLGYEDLQALVRALVVFNKQVSTNRGWSAAAIWTYFVFADRYADLAGNLADWALANRGSNTYIPFGHPCPTVSRSAAAGSLRSAPRPPGRDAP